MVGARAECSEAISKGPRPTHQAVTKGATASNGKDDDQLLVVSQSDPCPGSQLLLCLASHEKAHLVAQPFH